LAPDTELAGALSEVSRASLVSVQFKIGSGFTRRAVSDLGSGSSKDTSDYRGVRRYGSWKGTQEPGWLCRE
jgi:hypothetical protein